MIDLNLLKNKNTIIVSTPRSSSTYFLECVYESMLERFGYESIKVEDEIPNTLDENNISTICKLLLPNYKDVFFKESQIIILYPRKDYISHYTSLIIPLYSEIVSDKMLHWNAIPNENKTLEITADDVKKEFESLNKIDNARAKKLIAYVTQVMIEFKIEVDKIKKSNTILFETSYDEVYNWNKNNKQSLIWKDPKDKLQMFEDPSFVINEIERSISSIGHWPTKNNC